MGLDMYTYETSKNNIQDGLQVDNCLKDTTQVVEFWYWRKHPDLHGWFQKLYVSKGGKDQEFDCTWMELTQKDTSNLKEAVLSDRLPATRGFFFGESQPYQKDETLDFIKKAEIFWRDQQEDSPKTLFYFPHW